ncbi:MAG: hypothetical protein K6G22_11425 [Lachnospiraceae bacterium]|nr:hypothetical protein [Lachnospiraceae bacterium]
MKLTGDLKKKVDHAASAAEKRDLIQQAGILLTDEELNMLSGGEESEGGSLILYKCDMGHYFNSPNEIPCPYCGSTKLTVVRE